MSSIRLGALKLILAALLALTFVSPALAAPAAAPACKLEKILELPVTMIGTRPTVPLKINGKDARFLVDSGAFFSMISPAAAAKFGLKVIDDPHFAVSGAGGRVDGKSTRVFDFNLGGVSYHGADLVVADGAGTEVDGLLGQNQLGSDDIEYDLANGVVRIFKPQHCQNRVLAYWNESGANQLDLIVNLSRSSYRVMAIGSLNGQKLRVQFDTGAGRSMLTLKAAERAGVTPQSPGVVSGGAVSGIGPRRVDSWIAHFDSFKLDLEDIQRTRLRIGAIELDDSDMLLGADFFLSHRVFIANSQHKLYFTYNGGGPAFQLETTPQLQRAEAAAQAGGAQPPAPTTAKADDLTDPDALARRAAASMARYDYPAAIADLTHAIALKPDDGVLRLRRGQAYNRSGNRALAKAEADAAAKLIPITAPEALQVGGLYMGAGFAKDGMAQNDLWIAANPKSEFINDALNSRCYTRAQLKIDLDGALADCNVVLKAQPENLHFRDSRAYLHLVRGEFDAAILDYDAILKAQPKTPLALYSRGVAKLRKGQKDAGNADIVAAVALEPRIAAQAKALGLTP